MREKEIYGYKDSDLPIVVEDGGADSRPVGWGRRNWFLRAVESGELVVREPRTQDPPQAHQN